MKRIFLIMMICCSFLMVEAQFPTEEQPIGFTLDVAQRTISPITFSAADLPDMNDIAEEDVLTEQETGLIRIGYPVRVNYTPDNSGNWVDLPDGGRLWRLEIILPGALATIASYDKFWLPEGAKFWVYNKTTRQYTGAVSSRHLLTSTLGHPQKAQISNCHINSILSFWAQ